MNTKRQVFGESEVMWIFNYTGVRTPYFCVVQRSALLTQNTQPMRCIVVSFLQMKKWSLEKLSNLSRVT